MKKSVVLLITIISLALVVGTIACSGGGGGDVGKTIDEGDLRVGIDKACIDYTYLPKRVGDECLGISLTVENLGSSKLYFKASGWLEASVEGAQVISGAPWIGHYVEGMFFLNPKEKSSASFFYPYEGNSREVGVPQLPRDREILFTVEFEDSAGKSYSIDFTIPAFNNIEDTTCSSEGGEQQPPRTPSPISTPTQTSTLAPTVSLWVKG